MNNQLKYMRAVAVNKQIIANSPQDTATISAGSYMNDMKRGVIKSALGAAYFEGIDTAMHKNGDFKSLISKDTLMDFGLRTGVGYVSDQFLVPMIAPMISIGGLSTQTLAPIIDSAAIVGAEKLLGRENGTSLPMNFLMTLGASVAAEYTVDPVMDILGY